MTDTDAEDSPRRVLVVRCPAWIGPGQGRQAARPGAPAGEIGPAGLGGPTAQGGPGGAEEQETRPNALVYEQVVSAVREFCPQIEVLRPGLCAIGVRGPARYFGGEAELARKIAQAVAWLGFDCLVGIADGMYAALLAAKMASTSHDLVSSGPSGGGLGWLGWLGVLIVPPGASPAFLAPHPIGVLGQPELADVLSRLGIGTLGEFATLPAVDVETRFGASGLLAHRLACGLDPRPLAASPPAADLSVHAEFDPPAAQSEPVVFAAKTLAGQMHALLAAAGLACVRMRVHVVGEDGQEVCRLWRHDGLLSELAVAERVRWQLEGWRTGQDSGDLGDEGIERGGIVMLVLTPDQLVHDRGRQLGLWGDAVVSDRVARAAIRVQAMLGHGAVLQPVLTGGRSPGEQALAVPFGEVPVPLLPADRPWPGRIPAPAPATVYSVPRQGTVTDGSGVLVSVTGRGQVSASPAWLAVDGRAPLAVTAWTGPWPVSERWWDPVRACRKARFQLVTEDGSAWLAVVKDGRWLIEASYD